MSALQLPILWGVEGFRVRRIKTFESLRPAKFPLPVSGVQYVGVFLGCTVNIARTEQHLASGDSHHLAGRKQARERAPCRSIMTLVVERHDDALVRDIEIDVRRRQAIAG